MTKSMKTLGNTLLIIFITLLLLVVMEAALRVVFGKPVSISLQYSPYVYNPVYQVGLKPSNSNVFKRSKANGSASITWQTNSQGFRGPELQANPDYRVMVFGDSNILARFSEEPNTFVSKLKDNLAAKLPGKQVEVINSGIVGAGTDQLVLKMQEDVPKLKPDLVVLHIFSSNDLGDMIRNRLFELDEKGDLTRTGFPVLVDAKMKPQNKLISFLTNTRLYNAAGRINSRITGKNNNDPAKILSNLEKTTAAEYEVYTQHEAQQFSHFDDHYDIDLATQPQSQSAITKLQLLSAMLRKAGEICADNNAQLMILVQPAVYDLCQNHLFGPKELAVNNLYKPDNICSAIMSVCNSNNLYSLNLYEPFKASQPENLHFRTDDDHWNDAGQLLAAELTANYIMDQGFLATSSK